MQLAAVEDEKRVLEEEVSRQAGGHQRQLEDLAVQHDRRGLEVEELERQLQASHKCYVSRRQCSATSVSAIRARKPAFV